MNEDGDARAVLSVGEVAARSGVAVSTLHFYEKKGLIEGWRTSGNQRRYPRGVLRRVAIVKIAQRAGIPLQVIKQALATIPPDHSPNAKDWARFVSSWREMLDERITSLTQLRDQLTSCIGCGCMSLKSCPLRNPGDRLGRDGAGARLLIDKPARRRRGAAR